MKFKVNFIIFDCHEWSHVECEEIVEADSPEAAKEEIKSRSSICTGDYIVDSVVEVLEEYE